MATKKVIERVARLRRDLTEYARLYYIEGASQVSDAGGKISLTLVDCAQLLTLTSSAKLAQLPDRYKSLAPQATQATLAGIRFPKDEDYCSDAVEFLQTLLQDHKGTREAAILVKGTGSNGIALRIQPAESDSDKEPIDVSQTMLSNGLVTVEKRMLRRLLHRFR